MKNMKKIITACVVAVSCFMPCFYENVCESAENENFENAQIRAEASSEVYELMLNIFEAQRTQDISKGFEYIEQGIERYPDIAYFYYLRGGFCKYPKLNKKEEIVQSLDRAIELDPNFADAYIMRAEAFIGNNQYDKALSDYNRAIELEPDRAYPYRGRASIYKKYGEADKVFADCKKVVELDPDYSTAEHFELTGYLYSKGKFDEAIAECSKMIDECKKAIESAKKGNNSTKGGNSSKEAIKTSVPMSALMCTFFPAQEEEVGRAFDVVIKAMHLSNVYVLRGKSYYELGKYEEALEDGKKALSVEKTTMGAQRLVDLSERALKNK